MRKTSLVHSVWSYGRALRANYEQTTSKLRTNYEQTLEALVLAITLASSSSVHGPLTSSGFSTFIAPGMYRSTGQHCDV